MAAVLAESPARAILRATNVHLGFGGVMALAGVDIAVRAGEICSIIGPNGAGKTTMLNAIRGVFRVVQGYIEFDGRDVTRARTQLLAGMGLARTFQNLTLFHGMTVRENIFIGRHALMKCGVLACGLHYGPARAEEQWDWQPVEEIKALMRPGEPEIHYTSLGNVFLGTMLPAYLNMWGIRTVILSGYHLDWCIEQAARTCRDMGYMPIVIGDACGCGVEADEEPTLQRLERFFAPVISTDRAIGLIQQGAARRAGG